MPRDFIFLNCQDGKHDWRSLGGCNAGCHEYCTCSVPVHQCGVCGDCDYGQNEEADEILANCQTRYEMLNPLSEIEATKSLLLSSFKPSRRSSDAN